MANKLYELLIIILSTLAAVAMVAIPVWLLWNWLMPTIFMLPRININQAFGLTLFTTLFNGVLSTGMQKTGK